MLTTLLILSAAWLSFVAFLVVRAVIQYRAYRQILPRNGAGTFEQRIAAPAENGAGSGGRALAAPTVAVIVPARDEIANISRCLDDLQGQDFRREKLHIFIVDDGSTDGTVEAVQAAAGRDAHVHLVDAGALPDGWKGKPHACSVGVARAEQEIAGGIDWLCFIDADTFAKPATISTAVAAAEENRFDMLSLEPFQELISFWERLIIPCGFFVMAFSHDLRRVNDPNQADAVANGQFILIRDSVYQQVGGHARVRDEICEDSALARLVKSSGKNLAVWGAEALLRTRMYRDLASLWEGLAKNVVEMVGGWRRTMALAGMALLIAVVSIALPIATTMELTHAAHAWLAWLAAIFAWAGSATLVGIHVGGANYLRIPLWYGLLFPIGYTIGACLVVQSAIARRHGAVMWKGRSYAAEHTS